MTYANLHAANNASKYILPYTKHTMWALNICPEGLVEEASAPPAEQAVAPRRPQNRGDGQWLYPDAGPTLAACALAAALLPGRLCVAHSAGRLNSAAQIHMLPGRTKRA